MDGQSPQVQIASHYANLSQSDQVEWWFALSFVGRLVAYIVLIVVLVLVVMLVLKFLEVYDCYGPYGGREDGLSISETSPLRPPAKEIPVSYGACEEDLESGNYGSGGSSEEDLYDGKICVICYDEPRNCFFVPCGHCATCYDCAQRIIEGESKTCPVCRRFIGKVRKLFSS